MVRRVIACCVLGVCVLAGQARAEPEVFSKAGYKADQSAVADNGKLHVLYFTASWCPPCQQMKKTTWIDESVVSWLGEHAVVTPIDVDVEVGLSQEYGIQAMPTIVVLNEGEEVGRGVGYRGPVEFRDWLVKAEAGELPPFVQQTPEEIYNKAFESARETGKRIRGFQDRLMEAESVMYLDPISYEQASELFAAIFPELLEAGYIDMWDNYSFTVGYLVGEYPPARVTFTSLRDQLESDLKGGKVSWDALSGWASLNGALGDEDRTLSWLERRVAAGEGVPSSHLIHELAQAVALDARRFDLVKEITDPVYECQKVESESNYMLMSLGSTENSDSENEMLLQSVIEMRRYSMASQYAIALGIGDGEAVKKVQQIFFSKDDTPEARQVLWEAAVNMGTAWSELPE